MAKEERIRVIEEKNIHLWFLGSPVALCSMKLELNETKNSMFAYSKMMNVQPENIKAVLFDVICYDSVHKVVDTMHKVAYYELDIPRNGVFGMDTPIRIGVRTSLLRGSGCHPATSTAEDTINTLETACLI